MNTNVMHAKVTGKAPEKATGETTVKASEETTVKAVAKMTAKANQKTTKKVARLSHLVPDVGPADLTLALWIARELHTPPAPERRPEITVPQMMGLRMPADRPRRHKVQLKRLTAVRGC